MECRSKRLCVNEGTCTNLDEDYLSHVLKYRDLMVRGVQHGMNRNLISQVFSPVTKALSWSNLHLSR